MKFNIEVNNLGKVKQAKLKLAPFSVIAGANSSGKSFVSRALYSFFSTINKDHVTADALEIIVRITSILRSAYYAANNPSLIIQERYSELTVLISHLKESISKELGSCTYIEQHTRAIILEEQINHAENMIKDLLLEIDNKKKYIDFKERISLANRHLKELKNNIKNPSNTLGKKIEQGFTEALKENFQVANLSDLKNFTSQENEAISFNFGSLGEIKIDKELIQFKLTAESVHEFQSLYNVVFIESPIYWKLRKPLIKAKDKTPSFLKRFHREAESLSGVPKYFYDLIELVDANLKSNSRNESIASLEEKINTTLGGELDISESGDIFFKDSETSESVNINLTATGVTNLGLIGLLLKRNVIAKGSFIFFDEPEVNLHPAWQKVMVETLYQLSRNGINVVIASHSIDMMKYIENIMDPLSIEDIEEHFAINRLEKNGVSIIEDENPRQSMSKIKEDLGSTFYDMVLGSDW
ncbi:AAA family ATPase [Photobacterium piscicola]|uniref:AAA family ATPase n=1 Tax=Photobacterium piscicola TaxID=1378299 RepID=UPI003734DAB5